MSNVNVVCKTSPYKGTPSKYRKYNTTHNDSLRGDYWIPTLLDTARRYNLRSSVVVFKQYLNINFRVMLLTMFVFSNLKVTNIHNSSKIFSNILNSVRYVFFYKETY